MMPIGKKITVMENEEKISVVSVGLLSDKTAEKIGVLTATIVYDEEEIGIVSEGLMNEKATEKIGVLTATIVYDEEKIVVVSEGLMNDKAAEKIGVLKKDILEGRKIERYWDCKFIIAIELSSIWSE